MDRGRTVAALLALAACIACSTAAPMASNQTALELLEGPKDGCYYNFQHYGENDRIMTNEPCLNCTCHNRMLMCYLRVCPFTKAIGQDCTVEKRADQCCPIVTCPDVPVDLLTSTSTSSPAEYGATGLGKLDKYGCSINGKYFSEGAKVPPSPNKPCEHCYCIRNMTTCVMQECTLHVDGCTPIYHKDVCCPVRYSCDHPEEDTLFLDDMTTTVRPTPGFLLTTTSISPVTQATQDCIHADQVFSDGALIKTEKACEHCYCMKGDIVCVVQECGTPMENEGKNCTSLPPRHGQCCPDTYICEGDEPGSDIQTEIPEITTAPPRRGGVEGSGYRNEPDESFTGVPPLESIIEGSGEENLDVHTDTAQTFLPEKVTSEINDFIVTTTESPKISHSTESDEGKNTIEDVENNVSIKEQITTHTTESNIGEQVTQEDIKTSYDDKLPTAYLEYHTTSAISNAMPLEDISVTTESTEKTDEHNVNDGQKTTTLDSIDEMAIKQDEKNMVTTMQTEITKANDMVYDTKTTPDLSSKKTEQDHFDNKYYATTESFENIKDFSTEDRKKTTIRDLVEEITPKQEQLDVNDLVTTESVQTIEQNIIVNDKETTLDSDISTPKQDKIDSNHYATTESAQKIEDSFIIDGKKTTMHDFVDDITPYQEHIDDNDSVTTESAQQGDEDFNSNSRKTTTKDFEGKITKQELLNENDLVTTESTHKVDANVIPGSEITTITDYVDVTTKQEHIEVITPEPTDKLDNDVNIYEKKTTQYLSDETTTQENLDKNILVSTEAAEKTDELINDDVIKTTNKHSMEETTTHRNVDNKDSITTESVDKVDENIIVDVEKTTTKYYDGDVTKSESIGENDSVTTELLHNVDDNIIVDGKKTTIQDLVEETTLKQENFATKIDDTVDLDHRTSTQVPERVHDIEYTKSQEELTTQKSEISDEFTMHEKESFTAKPLEKTDSYPSTTENLYSDKTTSINLIENEIIDNITPTPLPSRIPGEGDCLLNSVTYRNNSIVPSINNCHTSCKCVSSIIKCDPIICSPPPEYMNDCEPFYDSPDSCCPTYLCNTKEATPPQPHNQMSDSDNKNNLAASECNTSDCIEQSSQTTSDCHGIECKSSHELCDKESGCPETTVVPSCKGENCGENAETSSTKETETSDQNINVADCEDESNCRKPVESNIESECADDKCKRKQQEEVESKPSFECLGSKCDQFNKVLPSELPITELPVSDYSSAETTVATDSDKTVDQDIKPVEVKVEEFVTQEPSSLTTVKQLEFTEKIETDQPSISNEKITTSPEIVTEVSDKSPTDDAQTQMKSTESYETEQSRTETAQKVETSTDKTLSLDGESQVTKTYEDEKLQTSQTLIEKEQGNSEGYETTTKVLKTDDRDESSPEKLHEKESTNAPIPPFSDIAQYVTTSISETDQMVTEKQSHDTLAPYDKDNHTISVAFEEENSATGTPSSNVPESESDNKLFTQTPNLESSEQDKTPMSVSYETTENPEVATGYPEKSTLSPNQIFEIESELQKVHSDSLTTTGFKDTVNTGDDINEGPTTEINLKVSDPTVSTLTQHVLESESSTADKAATTNAFVDSYTHKITETELKPTELPEDLVTVKQNIDLNSDLEGYTPYVSVTNNVDVTSEISLSMSTELPLHTESDGKATIAPVQITKEQEKETSNAEPSQENTDKLQVGEDTIPITEKDESSTETSDIQIKETLIPSTTEKSVVIEEGFNNGEMANTLVTEENSNTESPKLHSTILYNDKTIAVDVESHTNIPHRDITDKKVSGEDDISVVDDTLTTLNTLYITETPPPTVSDQSNINHFVEPISNENTASTEKVVSVTEELLFTNLPKEVDKAQTEIDAVTKVETSVTEGSSTQKVAFVTTETEISATELSSLDNQEHVTEIATVTKLPETSEKGQTPPSGIFETSSEVHEINTEYSTKLTQHSEHQDNPSQEDITTLAGETLILGEDVTTFKPEIAKEQETTDVNPISDDKEHNIKPTEISIKQEVTTEVTTFDSNPSTTTSYVLEFDKTEPSIVVDIKESDNVKFSETPQSHVTEASNEKQDYSTEPNIPSINVENDDKSQPSGSEKPIEKETNVDVIVTVTPDLYSTAKEEMITKESPTVLHEVETKSPELYTTLSDLLYDHTTEKEYTRLQQSSDKIPHVATSIIPLEENIDIEITTPIITETHTEGVLREKTTLNSYNSEVPSLADSTTTQRPIYNTENIKSTVQELYSTISETSVTETIDHVDEQQPLEVNESNKEKITTEENLEKQFELTTKLPYDHITNKDIQTDISTEYSIQPGNDIGVSISQEEVKTESPELQYDTFSTVSSKTDEKEGITETIFQDDKVTNTPIPEINIQNEVNPTQPEYEIEKTTQKQTIAIETEPELITTEPSLSKETSSDNLSVSLVTEKINDELHDKQAEPHVEVSPIVTENYDMANEQSTLYTAVPKIETTPPNMIDINDTMKVKPATDIIQMESDITEKPATSYGEISALPDVTGIGQNYATELPSVISTESIDQNDLHDETQNTDKEIQVENHTFVTQVTEIEQMTSTNTSDYIKDEIATKKSEISTDHLEDVATSSSGSDKISTITEASIIQSHKPDPQEEKSDSDLEVTQTTVKYILPETTESTKESFEVENKYSETTPYLIELEEHTHQIKDDITSGTSMEEELTTMRYVSQSTERGDQPLSDDLNEYNNGNKIEQNYTENVAVTPPAEEQFFEDTYKTTLKEEMPTTSTYVIKDEESSTKYITTTEDDTALINIPSSSLKPVDVEMHTLASYDSEKSSSPATETEMLPEKETHKEVDRTDKPEPVLPNKDVTSIIESTTTKVTEEIATQSVELDKTSQSSEKPAETYYTPETPKPEFSEPPSDDVQSPDFPPSGTGGYGQDPDYGEEDQTFGPGTCRYGGKVYVSAQQIPRDDPCDFCFCFRSDIICLQQSCPPPIHGCHEEPIQGFCCPRYECPVSMATAVNVTTTTTTTTTTLPPHFLPHAYKGAAQRRGCQIKGHTYKVGEVVRASSGPCLHCTCGGDGQMKCDPKVCTPEPMLRQMIAAAVSSKRRR